MSRPIVTRIRVFVVPLLVVLLGACGARRLAPHPADMSGFLDDYALLREGGADDVRMVYRNPDANWPSYDKVLLEPVTLWRSGKGSLDPVPEADLLRLASDFERAVRTRLGKGFGIVDEPGPGVMRIRLGITAARASDPILDVLTASGNRPDHPAGDGPLDPETRHFLEGAVIEGEMRDAQSGVLLAQGVDRRRRTGSLEGVVDTWAQIDQVFAFWADRVCSRLEARTRR
jgi:hypothetical protein